MLVKSNKILWICPPSCHNGYEQQQRAKSPPWSPDSGAALKLCWNQQADEEEEMTKLVNVRRMGSDGEVEGHNSGMKKLNAACETYFKRTAAVQ